MQARPIVGVTTYHREIEERPRFHLPSAYVDAVRAGGGMPVLLTPGEERPAELLERLDALVFSGGGDLDPVHFGVMLVLALGIGQSTPPVGVALFVACSVGKARIGEVVLPMLPFLGAMIVALLIVAFCPPLTTWLPEVLMGQ